VTIGPDRSKRLSPDKLVRDTTIQCLELLEDLGLDTISFPALGTGLAGFPMESAAAAMADVITHHLRSSDRELKISIDLFARRGQETAYLAFFEEFARRNPAIDRHRTEKASVAPDRSLSGTTGKLEKDQFKLLDLEKQRQRLEQEYILAIISGNDAAVAAIRTKLHENSSTRLQVAANEQVERIPGVSIFISYAREDRESVRALKNHMSNLQGLGLVSAWHDAEISPGVLWETEIKAAMAKAELMLLLVSSDFMSSDYIRRVEVKQAFERQSRNLMTIVPILIRSVDIVGNRLSALQALPSNGRPVSEWPDADKAYVDIVDGIRRTVESIRSSKRATRTR
jgi:hypothetical protein